MTHVLTSVSFSHYVEKARWALDRHGVEYQERRFLPLLHFAGVWSVHRGKAGASDKASSRYSTPVLQTPDGDVLCDSSQIVRHLSDHYAPEGQELYPTEEVAELEQHFHDVMGPHTRRVVYGTCFRKPELLHALARNTVDPVQARALRLFFPLVEGGIRKLLGIDDAAVARSLDKSRREFDALSERLADGRRYLVQDRFTAADLAAACMGAPLILPREYGVWLPAVDDLPDDIRELVLGLRESPAGEYIGRMFRTHRHEVVARASHPG